MSTVSCDKMLSVKDSLLLQIKKHKKRQICVMDFANHRGISLILIGRSVIQLVVCLFDVNTRAEQKVRRMSS